MGQCSGLTPDRVTTTTTGALGSLLSVPQPSESPGRVSLRLTIGSPFPPTRTFWHRGEKSKLRGVVEKIAVTF